MAPNHTNPGPQLHQSRAKPAALNRTNPGPQYREYSLDRTGGPSFGICMPPEPRAAAFPILEALLTEVASQGHILPGE